MVYKNNPKTTGNSLCLNKRILYKIYKKIESAEENLYIALAIFKRFVQKCVDTEGGNL